jgi:hypothetical protein
MVSSLWQSGLFEMHLPEILALCQVMVDYGVRVRVRKEMFGPSALVSTWR